jgi:hypothetical protein
MVVSTGQPAGIVLQILWSSKIEPCGNFLAQLETPDLPFWAEKTLCQCFLQAVSMAVLPAEKCRRSTNALSAVQNDKARVAMVL